MKQLEFSCSCDGQLPENVSKEDILKVEVRTCGLMIDVSENILTQNEYFRNGVDYILTLK